MEARNDQNLTFTCFYEIGTRDSWHWPASAATGGVGSCVLGKEAGRPVRVADSRAGDMSARRPQPRVWQYIKTGWEKNGALLAKYPKIGRQWRLLRVRSGADALAVRADDMYRIQSAHSVCDLYYTNNVPTGPIRGFGIPQAVFSLESQFNRAAKKLAIDSIDLRLRNAVERRHLPPRSNLQKLRTQGVHAACPQRIRMVPIA